MTNELKPMSLEPLGDRVLVKVDLSETVSKGGIILPSTTQKKTQTGDVVAAGPDLGKGLPRVPFSPGNKVLFDQYAGTSLDIDGIAHVLLREADVLAVVRG